MSDITISTREFGSCLACGKPITATAEVRITDLQLDGATGTANVEMVGLYVAHDCRTQEDPPATDEWIEVDDVSDLPDGTRIRTEWLIGSGVGGAYRRFVHRDDFHTAAEPVRCGGCRGLGPHAPRCDGGDER